MPLRLLSFPLIRSRASAPAFDCRTTAASSCMNRFAGSFAKKRGFPRMTQPCRLGILTDFVLSFYRQMLKTVFVDNLENNFPGAACRLRLFVG